MCGEEAEAERGQIAPSGGFGLDGAAYKPKREEQKKNKKIKKRGGIRWLWGRPLKTGVVEGGVEWSHGGLLCLTLSGGKR
jgi:hypothetical protein